jgi:hypothetical protein
MNQIKTSSVVGYHIEMPANARLRSSGFWEIFGFFRPRRVRKIPIATYQSRDRRETIKGREKKRVRGGSGNLEKQKPNKKKKKKKKRFALKGWQILPSPTPVLKLSRMRA